MPKHIQRRATRQRADFAGSLRDGSYFRQGGVAKALWCAHSPTGHHGAFRSYPWRKSDPAKGRNNSPTDPKMSRTVATDQTAGFTLIELLVAFSLLGLIAAMSLGALQFGARVWERAAAQGDAGQGLQLAQGLVRRQLGQAVARIRSQPNPASKLFRGETDGLEFVASLPGSAAAGALYDQRLFLREDQLMLSWRERHDVGRSGTPPNGGEAVVLGGVADLQIAYLDLSDSNRGVPWRTDWRKPGLPPLVRLRLVPQQPGREIWPELLVRLPQAKRPARGGGRLAVAGAGP